MSHGHFRLSIPESKRPRRTYITQHDQRAEEDSTFYVHAEEMAFRSGPAVDVTMEDGSVSQIVQENQEAKAMIAQECRAADEKRDTNVLEEMEGGTAIGISSVPVAMLTEYSGARLPSAFTTKLWYRHTNVETATMPRETLAKVPTS